MKKLLAVLLVTLLALTGCSGKKVTYVTDYNYVYSTDIETLDYTASMRATNADHTQNFVDTLYELDNLGNLIPALATSYEVSEDGKTYTFKIREGVKWVTNTGDEYADVTAHDFVFGMKHAFDVKSEMRGIVENSIVGLSEYRKNPSVGFDKVGVKATDDYTLVYTLNEPESFFLTKINYGIFQPVNEEFVVSLGGSKNFGKIDPATILYNGPYLFTNNTSQSVIEYKKNASYWDAENVHVENVKLIYYTGDNPGELYTNFANGTFTQARVFPNDPTWAAVQEKHADNVIFSELNGVVFNFNWNLNRRSYNATTKKDDTQKNDTKVAILNKDFRQAVNHAFSREDYLAQSVGKDAAKKLIRNDFLPPAFAAVYGINDTVDYPKLVLDELAAINANWKGYDLTDGQDAYFNADKAKAFADAAKTALTAKGVTFPVQLDLPFLETSAVAADQVKSFKKSVEDTLGADFVTINVIPLSKDNYYAATYLAETGADSDYDLSNASGWGPDYGDPSTYLNIYNSHTGDMLATIGLDARGLGETDNSAEARAAIGIDEYDKLLAAANAEQDTAKRLALFAKADAWMVDAGIQMPIQGQGGTPSVTKVVPFTRAYGWSGNGDVRFKYVKIQDTPVTLEAYNKAKADWDKARAK